MQLKPSTLLQGGKYRIVRTLGQGGFGITYEAEQVLLRRTVAVKEFFMKDCCERDDATSRVTVGTGNQRALVERFRGKFIREAQMIAGMDHPHIVRVLDVFEENGTAYYVMDFLPGDSLANMVKKDGPLSEAKADKFIRQVADALDYIHGHNTVHLDVKPSNILLNAKGEAILIDFGISKHYDDSGDQTSSSPVGISKGYAPLEQGRDGDVKQFGPSTDIYALGATLYYLITGVIPPEASIVNEEGIIRPQRVSDRIWNTIEQSMRPRRKDRPQSIGAFLSILNNHSADGNDSIDNTIVMSGGKESKSKHHSWKFETWQVGLLLGIAAILTAAILFMPKRETKDSESLSSEISQQEETHLESTLQPSNVESEHDRLGSIKVTSNPSGAIIWLDGKNTKKKAPCVLTDIIPGKHTIKLVMDGYSNYEGMITVSSGKQAVFDHALIDRSPAPSNSTIRARVTSIVAYNGMDRVTNLSDDVSYFITSITLLKNANATKGPLRVYICVKGPNGITLKNQSSRTFSINGENLLASASREVDYEGDNLDLVIYFKDVGDIQPGVFTVDAFTEQSHLGQAKVELSPSKDDGHNMTMTLSGVINGHEWVDLGLSVKWATCNVGASSPSDYGRYFAWGENKSKSDYTWENYTFRISGDSHGNVQFSKYNMNRDRGVVDNKKRLDLSDDAARSNWGGTWRMPTKEEFNELLTKCDWTWTTLGGKNGYKVTSKTNGNSIFLPAAGQGHDSTSGFPARLGLEGHYWSSSVQTLPGDAFCVYFSYGGSEGSGSNRSYGFSVRPITN